MKNKPLVSIIVPVYNNEKYVKECIDSLLNQTYDNIEIIVINDGSVDNTKKILEKNYKDNEKVNIIEKENEGVSAARNQGLKVAKGEYICFCDSDDSYFPNGIENLVNEFNECDMVICSHVKEWIKISECIYEKKKISKEILMSDFILNKEYFSFIWGNLYSAEIIKKNNLIFDPEIKFSEDFDFNLKYVKCTDKAIKISDSIVYKYNISRSGEHEKRDYPKNDLDFIFVFFGGKENVDDIQFKDIVRLYLRRCVNRTYSWYNTRKTAQLVRVAFTECEEYIDDEILDYSFNSIESEYLKEQDYYSFIKEYLKNNKHLIYDKYRFRLSKTALKIITKIKD